MMIPNPIQSAALARPEHALLITPGERITAREMLAAVVRRAAALDVGPGDVVPLPVERTAEWVVDLHAVGWTGAAAAPRQTARATIPDVCGGGHPGAWTLAQPRLVVETSGTTGAPKRITITTGQLLFGAFGSAIRLGHLPTDRWLHCLPLDRIGGLAILFRCAFYATTVELLPRFCPLAVAERLDSGTISQISLTPTMLADVLDARREVPFPAALRAILVGGDALPVALRGRCRALGAPVAETWGMTEAGSQICTRAPGDLREGALPPLPFARITAEDVLVVEGPLVGGRLRTGDRGRVEGGGVVVDGRADGVIVSGGINLSPGTIEAALAAHPEIVAAAVVAVPHARWGHRPVAHLVGRGGPVDAAELDAFCAARLARYERPDAYRWHASPARLRQEVQALHAVDEGLRDAAGLEAGQIHEGVLQAHGAAEIGVVGAGDGVGEDHRALAQPVDGGPDGEAVAVSDGTPVARFGVHQRHPEAEVLEESRDLPEGRAQQLLEAHVGVLVGPREEDDADAVHLVEAGGEDVLERHGAQLQEGPG